MLVARTRGRAKYRQFEEAVRFPDNSEFGRGDTLDSGHMENVGSQFHSSASIPQLKGFSDWSGRAKISESRGADQVAYAHGKQARTAE